VVNINRGKIKRIYWTKCLYSWRQSNPDLSAPRQPPLTPRTSLTEL
jgi:hypothetical protein